MIAELHTNYMGITCGLSRGQKQLKSRVSGLGFRA